MLIASSTIGFIGSIARGHHTSIVGSNTVTPGYFTISTSIIAIPTATKIFNWLGTLWTGCSHSSTSSFSIIGMLFSFSSGGSSGSILANPLKIDIPRTLNPNTAKN